jgi:hypothetical protein
MSRVLLLNATFEPLQLVSERRAVVLMLAGRAEAIAMPEEPEVCRSASIVVEIPAIVRLHDMVKIPSKIRCSCAIATAVRTAWNTPTRSITWCRAHEAGDTSGPTSSRRVDVTTC